MRTPAKAIDYIKERDPGSCITKNFLYTEARAGRLPGVVRVGNRYLINMEELERYLSSGMQNTSNELKGNAVAYGHLRRIDP